MAATVETNRSHDLSNSTAHDTSDHLSNGHVDHNGSNGTDSHGGRSSADASANHHHPSNAMGPQTTKKAGGKKKPVDPNEGYNLLATRISQLETDANLEEEEEKAMARAVRKANKELADLVNNREDHLAKVEAIQQKYSELFQEMKKLERDYNRARRRADQLQKEKDHNRSELTKANNMKNKLEQLCRELQKENRRVKDESKVKEQSEKDKREELSTKFENTIWEIKNRMEEDTDTTSSKALNMEVDALIKLKFRTLIDQYEMRELHFQSLLRTKELEVQYNLARYDQKRKQADAEAMRAKALHAQVSTFSQTETELRSQLNIYVEKFKQVEDTLNNSNDLFLTFRKEMEEMSKKTKRLEKENMALTRKSDLMNRNILEMAEERTRQQRELEAAKKKSSKLEDICRALQSERTALENKLRGVEEAEEEDEYSDAGEDDEGSEEGDEEGEEEGSEYLDSEEEDEEDDDEDDEETEDEGLFEDEVDATNGSQRVNGTPPPPPPPPPSSVQKPSVNHNQVKAMVQNKIRS
ncbi:Gamma-taxilin [Arthrobotrys entomopaga]|nr:Gamma-taxilin [Arthrobotrys entomopaga]